MKSGGSLSSDELSMIHQVTGPVPACCHFILNRSTFDAARFDECKQIGILYNISIIFTISAYISKSSSSCGKNTYTSPRVLRILWRILRYQRVDVRHESRTDVHRVPSLSDAEEGENSQICSSYLTLHALPHRRDALLRLGSFERSVHNQIHGINTSILDSL